MHCTPWIIAQTADHRTQVYAFALWALVVLLAALLMAMLVIRLIRMWWARSDARSAARQRDHADSRDPWTESGRRVSVDPTPHAPPAPEDEPDESDR